MNKARSGGGRHSIAYTWQKARDAGGVGKLYRAMRTRNACKTCALGMGGQLGGMVTEDGRFPEVCKKGLQAMASDLQAAIPREFWSRNPIVKLRDLSSRELELAGRLVDPVLYTQETGHFQPITWDEALRRITTKLRQVQADKTFWYFSGRSSNEAGFLLQLFARLYGTNNVNNCSYYCHQASGVGMSSSIGSGTATIVLDDLKQSDLVFVIGANPASNHPRLMRSLLHVRRRGGKIVVINPVREPGLERFRIPGDLRSMLSRGRITSHFVQPHIGGDLALLTGIAKRILEMGAHDEAFLLEYCTGWTELKTHLTQILWSDIVAASGVQTEEIDTVAELYASSKRVVFSWAMGITHHTRGVENVQAITNLALMRGMIGQPGSGLMPLRGHSNVQGIGSVGVTPKLKKVIFERLQGQFGVELPVQEGRDTMACMEDSASGRLKVGFCLGGNLYGSNPDSTFAASALANLDQLVYVNTTLNTGHARGLAPETIILPVLARDEEPEATTQESMFNYVRLSDGGPPRHAGPRSEVDVIATIAEHVLGNTSPVEWSEMRRTADIRKLIGSIIPGYEAISEIDRTKEEFQISGRTFHAPRFPTSDGRARLHVHPRPAMSEDHPVSVALMTIRSEGQFNTVVHEEHDLFRGVDGRNVILLHPDDIERFLVVAGQKVSVHGPAGIMKEIRVHPFRRIKPGNAAMYFPEANILLDRTLDPQSRTPAFRGARVRVISED